jgi:hypothetical protein
MSTQKLSRRKDLRTEIKKREAELNKLFDQLGEMDEEDIDLLDGEDEDE